MDIEKDLLDRLPADYKKPEDLIGRYELLKNSSPTPFWSGLWKGSRRIRRL
jgi:hypothetical protein